MTYYFLGLFNYKLPIEDCQFFSGFGDEFEPRPAKTSRIGDKHMPDSGPFSCWGRNIYKAIQL